MKKYHLKCLGLNMYTVLSEIWRDDKGILVERDEDKYRYYISNEELERSYEGYKEPRKLKGWVNIYKRVKDGALIDGGVIHRTESAARGLSGSLALEYVSTITISYTEGE